MTHKSRYLPICGTLPAVAGLTSSVARSDRRPATGTGRPEPAAASRTAELQTTSEALAQRLARALAHPAFRAYLKAQLDSSPFREHKLHFQRFLGAHGGHARDEVARHAGVSAADVDHEAQAAIPLEFYLPVPAHRRAWTGDAHVLVATALRDHDVPVAFDPQGHRILLDPDRPPATPVIALVPVETDFTPRPAMQLGQEGCGSGGGDGGTPPPPPPPPAPTPGLYMTQAHFVADFEGWLKGAPEFELHMLGQKGQTDSLTDYQCAGEKQPAPYYFDQNALDWSGSVMLFSKVQLDA